MTALVGSAGVLLAACAGSATPSSLATSTPALDSCLVGTWTTVAAPKNSPINDENIVYSGGDGEVFTITAQGAVIIDTHAARPLVFTSGGETFTATVKGTGRGTLKTLNTAGTFSFQPSSGDTMTTTTVDSSGSTLGTLPGQAFTAFYTCTRGQSFTFYKSSVQHMIDGPEITLTATKP